MVVTVKEIVRKITEEGHLLDYFPQCLVMDFFEFVQMHEARKEYQQYYGDHRYETFKNTLLQVYVTNDFKLEGATQKIMSALNRGLSSFEQSRRVPIQYPGEKELKKELPNKKILKMAAESILENRKVPQGKGVMLTKDGVSAFVSVSRPTYSDLYNFTLHPYLPHLLEALIVLCLERQAGSGVESGVRLFYPALQEKGNPSYVPYFTLSGSEVYLTKKFTDEVWAKVLRYRDEIIQLKMPYLSEAIGENLEELTVDCEEGEEKVLTLVEKYEEGIKKLPPVKQDRFKVNDTTLLIVDDNLLRMREHWIRDGQSSRCVTQSWVP